MNEAGVFFTEYFHRDFLKRDPIYAKVCNGIFISALFPLVSPKLVVEGMGMGENGERK